MKKKEHKTIRWCRKWWGCQIVSGCLVSAILLSAGCSPIVGPTPSAADAISPLQTPAAQAEETIMPTPATEPATDANAAPSALDLAKTDLATRLSIEPDTIEVVAIQSVDWRDGSLGCPEPGMMYAQVIISGMRIVLAVDGTEYYYHSSPNREPFLCENPSKDGSLE